MINFVIYDDQEEFRSITRQAIGKILKNSNMEYNIVEFSKYDDQFLKVIKTSESKIYIMDIEVPNNPSGIEVAKKIRTDDWESIIILVTSHVDMGYDALKAQIMLLDFISKYNECEENLLKTLKKAVLKVNSKKTLIFQSNSVTHRVYLEDILYIVKDSVERKCIIKTTYSEFTVNKTIKEMVTSLDKRFFLANRSCLINTEKIDDVNWQNNSVTFKSGEKLDYLSRSKKKDLKKYVENI